MIDHRLLEAYIRELAALRTHGRDFSRAYPDIASRLDIGERQSRDPQVERVVESAAFLAARLRCMIEENATELPLTMLSMLAPVLVEPVPSMGIVELYGGSELQTVMRGTRLDGTVAGRAQVCLSTTMTTTVAPLTLRMRRLEPTAGAADGVGVSLIGRIPSTLVVCIGSNPQSSAALIDALEESLLAIDVHAPDGRLLRRLLPTDVRIHGFSDDEAALPVRPARHPAHRMVTEFLTFPEKFRFVSVTGGPLPSRTEFRLLFRSRLPLPMPLPSDLISVNRVPVVNLWATSASPIDVDGRQLEYPVRVDALRYRTVECHCVDTVDMHFFDSPKAQRLDPIVAFGDVRGTGVRWGVRRTLSQRGGEVLLYFQGLDYRTLGRQRMLAMPSVLASNRDLPEYLRVGSTLSPVSGLGTWRGRLVGAPTPFRPALVGAEAMERLIGFLQSSMLGLCEQRGSGRLSQYLRLFPGAERAPWLDALGTPVSRPVAVRRGGQLQPGLALALPFAADKAPTTSRTMLRRVFAQLFESQRGLNRIEQVSLDVG